MSVDAAKTSGAVPPPANWYAVHTRSRHERKVHKELTRHSIEAYLPEYRTWSRRKDRRKKIQKPLFPGYLFVHGSMTPGLRLSILQTTSVVRIVGSGTRPVPVPDHEVESIRILLEGEGEVSPLSEAQTGQLVQVMEGALSGVVGVVEDAHKRRIVVSVELLGRAVSATLDTESVVPYLDG
jgi:transcription termination/antitermination protein NusG